MAVRGRRPVRLSPVVPSRVPAYAVSGDGVVHAVDLATGAERWSVALGSEASASPLLVGDVLVVADGAGVVRALGAADGKPRWTAQTDGEISGSPAAEADGIVVATEAGTAYALDATSGQVIWHVALGEAATRSVAIAGGVAYIGLGGSIVALAVKDWDRSLAGEGRHERRGRHTDGRRRDGLRRDRSGRGHRRARSRRDRGRDRNAALALHQPKPRSAVHARGHGRNRLRDWPRSIAWWPWTQPRVE